MEEGKKSARLAADSLDSVDLFVVVVVVVIFIFFVCFHLQSVGQRLASGVHFHPGPYWCVRARACVQGCRETLTD